MASVIAVGHSASIVFGTSAFAAPIRVIGGFSQDREVVDASHLAMVATAKKLPTGLKQPGEFECEYIWDADPTLDIPPIDAAAELVTVTYPKGANTTGAKISGQAFIRSFMSPELNSEGLMVGKFTVAWEGGSATQPAFTGAVI